ncbi:hypothetical protein EXN66_Car002757 [Channa argus]|uniref:Uncharacterized protein n=1 Tax=Channa argus TaxID=215402 RepID=A0A6G1PA00_CHAAH|nr:hypothetical protein EXN66_Car002757 [Channa argus]
MLATCFKELQKGITLMSLFDQYCLQSSNLLNLYFVCVYVWIRFIKLTVLTVINCTKYVY